MQSCTHNKAGGKHTNNGLCVHVGSNSEKPGVADFSVAPPPLVKLQRKKNVAEFWNINLIKRSRYADLSSEDTPEERFTWLAPPDGRTCLVTFACVSQIGPSEAPPLFAPK